MRTVWPSSALAAANETFTALTADPDPLCLDLDSLPQDAGLPGGAMPLLALRSWLLERPHAHAAHDTVWAELVRRARSGRPEWVIAAVGMAMPSLLRSAISLRAGYSGDPDDIDAELVTGFLSALHDPRVRDLSCAQLCWAAWRAGHQLLRQDREHITLEDFDHVVASRPPRIPYGHPDVLVARAVALGLIDEDDAQAWIDTRLGWLDPAPLAADRNLTVDALRMRLGRIDRRLAAALADGLLTGLASTQAQTRLHRAAAHRAAVRAARLPSTIGAA